MKIIQDNKEINIEFISKIHLDFLKKKKKTAHAYLKHRIFSKSFGGKIRHIWTDVTYRTNKGKIGACVFLSFSSGKSFSNHKALCMSFSKVQKNREMVFFCFNSSILADYSCQKCAASVWYLLETCLWLALEASEILAFQSARK